MGNGMSVIALKKQAKAIFDKVGLPTQKNESWKYVDVDALVSQSHETAIPVQFKITGYHVSDSTPEDLSLGCSTSPFSYLNTAYFSDAMTLVITETTEEPITIEYEPTSFCYPRLNVRVKAGVFATVVLKTTGQMPAGDNSVENRVIDIALDRNASLFFVQDDGIGMKQRLSSLIVSLQERSVFNSLCILKDTLFTRHDTQVDFHGENASAVVRGIGLLRDKQEYYNHLTINHYVGHCNCEQLFKTILMDKSVSEFSGLVCVSKGAHGTDSSQLNKTLLLSDSARALSRPQLRIDADDVECAHGATVGQLDPDEVFYMRSRGITEQQASVILTAGFVQDVLDCILHEPTRLSLADSLKKEINHYVNR